MIAFQNLAERYIATWNEADAEARRVAVAELYTPDARYVDPLADAQGPEAIAATIGAVQGQFPGWRFRLVGPVDAHHDQARFSWELGPAGPGGEGGPDAPPAPIIGSDVVLAGPDGRLSLVLGFLDRVPA